MRDEVFGFIKTQIACSQIRNGSATLVMGSDKKRKEIIIITLWKEMCVWKNDSDNENVINR